MSNRPYVDARGVLTTPDEPGSTGAVFYLGTDLPTEPLFYGYEYLPPVLRALAVELHRCYVLDVLSLELSYKNKGQQYASAAFSLRTELTAQEDQALEARLLQKLWATPSGEPAYLTYRGMHPFAAASVYALWPIFDVHYLTQEEWPQWSELLQQDHALYAWCELDARPAILCFKPLRLQASGAGSSLLDYERVRYQAALTKLFELGANPDPNPEPVAAATETSLAITRMTVVLTQILQRIMTVRVGL